jgi:hypothetical protein
MYNAFELLSFYDLPDLGQSSRVMVDPPLDFPVTSFRLAYVPTTLYAYPFPSSSKIINNQRHFMQNLYPYKLSNPQAVGYAIASLISVLASVPKPTLSSKLPLLPQFLGCLFKKAPTAPRYPSCLKKYAFFSPLLQNLIA